MPTGSESTSPTPMSNTSSVEKNNCGNKVSTGSYDPTPYIQRARVTRPAPPKPSVNPLQFVQIKPCSLYQSAQEQLKKADEVKKVKEIKKEEPEDWQSNLDNWKSSRRKRVEHIIDRVVEVKKLEMEEHDRTRRKSKTFSEMLEERGSRRKMSTLPVYTEDESNDLSDLGIGTSSASGKSSLSEDCDNQSVMSDNVDTERAAFNLDNNSNHDNNYGSTRDYISSPGYDTSTSTAPASSPDPCEYTYEGAIQDYKTRVSGYYNNEFRSSVSSPYSKDSTPERFTGETLPNRRMSNTKIEDRLMNFEVKCTMEQSNENPTTKKDVPKIDIIKRRELFEKDNPTGADGNNQKRFSGDFSNSKTIRERLSSLGKKSDEVKKINRLSGDITSIKDRLQNLEKQPSNSDKPSKIDVPVVSLKERLSSLQNAAAKEEVKKPVALVDEHDLEMLRREEMEKQGSLKRDMSDDENLNSSQEILNIQDESNLDTDREDSGIHTTDVSCSVSQTDEQPEMVNEETHHHINEDCLCTNAMEQVDPEEIEVQLNSNLQQNSLDNDKEESIASPSPEPHVDQEASVNEALELALQAIDNEPHVENIKEDKGCERSIEKSIKSSVQQSKSPAKEPIYENITGSPEDIYQKSEGKQQPIEPAPITQTMAEITKSSTADDEPYYQVPKSSEPYYEVPKHTKPVPVYENVEIFYSGSGSSNTTNELPIGTIVLEPPKEKPPPPPVEELTDDEGGNDDMYECVTQRSPKSKLKTDTILENGNTDGNRPVKRMNSTKRIKKELRNKRSSFLGLEDNVDDDSFLELTVAPPPDMAQLLQEEKRLEKQLYMKAGLYDSSDTGSRDSGVSENHSRQSSEPVTSSEEHEDLLCKKEKEIIEVLEKEEEKRRVTQNWANSDDSETKIQNIEDQIREQEEVLRVERELLQLEQEELKRQRENLIIRENLARRELEHGAKMLMSANRHSLQDINATTNHYANVPNQIYEMNADYRKSMSDLQEFGQKRVPPTPPAKPLRSYPVDTSKQNGGLIKIAHQARLQHSQSTDDFVPLRNYQPMSAIHHGNMSRHTLHALSATPKPKFTDGWVNSRHSTDKSTDTWLSYQQKRKSIPEGFNYNKHWLIQEAEQRRIDQQRGLRNNTISNGWNGSALQRNGGSNNKALPDSVIQTLTQRVQSKGIGERKKLDTSSSDSISTTPTSPTTMNSSPMNPTLPDGHQEKILSVSGKKKCSHCGEELGRGAAMIIESLRLFFHINCFKCCVCHVQLSDGKKNGTDVRIRNHKLHCHNCYSSDDGIKFSCV